MKGTEIIEQEIRELLKSRGEDLEIEKTEFIEAQDKYKITFVVNKYSVLGFLSRDLMDRYIDSNHTEGEREILKEINRVSARIDQKIKNEHQKRL